MSRRKDGLDRLKAVNPIDESDVDGPDSARAQALLARITATPQQTQVPQTMTRRPLRLAIVLAAIVAATTAAAWLWTRIIETPNAVSCYEAVHLNADVAAAPTGGEATADACTPVWADGILVNSEIVPAGGVPPFTACVAENGTLAVFPTDDTTVCGRLDLAYPDPTGQDEADNLRDIEEQIILYFQSEDCIPLPRAETEVRVMLDESGLTDWTIEAQPENPDRPCASHSFDPTTQTIHLIPIPRT